MVSPVIVSLQTDMDFAILYLAPSFQTSTRMLEPKCTTNDLWRSHKIIDVLQYQILPEYFTIVTTIFHFPFRHTFEVTCKSMGFQCETYLNELIDKICFCKMCWSHAQTYVWCHRYGMSVDTHLFSSNLHHEWARIEIMPKNWVCSQILDFNCHQNRFFI